MTVRSLESHLCSLIGTGPCNLSTGTDIVTSLSSAVSAVYIHVAVFWKMFSPLTVTIKEHPDIWKMENISIVVTFFNLVYHPKM